MTTFINYLKEGKISVDGVELLRMFDQEKEFGVLRTMLSPDERKITNKLVKKGLVDKGFSDDKQKTRIFNITLTGQRELEKY